MSKFTPFLGHSIMPVFIMLAAIFAIDLLLVEENNVAFMYVLVLMLGLFFREKNDVVLLGLVATMLTFMAVFIKPTESSLQHQFFARTLSIAGIWAAAYLVITIISMRTDEALQDEQFHALFRFATNGIVITNHNGQITSANPAAEKLFGYGAEELNGLFVEALIPQRLARIHERHRQDYHVEPHPRSMGIGLDLYGLRKDGTEFPVEVSLSPFHTGQGDFVMAFVIDNTVRKEYEQRIVRQNQRLEQLASALQHLNESLEEKIRERTMALEQAKNDVVAALDKERELGELKSRFVSMASHEFRTPLSTVLSSAALIHTYADRKDYDNVVKHSLRIKTAVNSLNTILTEFLSLGKLEEGKTQAHYLPVSIPDLVEQVESELKMLFKTGQAFEYHHQGDTHAELDPGLFTHILINLIANAIKYSPENRHIRVDSRISGNQLHLSVIDQGIGIPESEKKHLFTRFFRGSNVSNTQGTGLGLYIVSRYVELMNGQIGFESEEGKGSTFWVTFPKVQEVSVS